MLYFSDSDSIIGAFGTLLTGLGLWALKRGRNYIEKRCRQAKGVVEMSRRASGSVESPPPSDDASQEIAPNPFLTPAKEV